MNFGRFELRSPGPGFNPKWYAEDHPDQKSSGLDPTTYYLLFGRGNGHKLLGAFERWRNKFDLVTEGDISRMEDFCSRELGVAPSVIVMVTEDNNGAIDRVIRGVREQIVGLGNVYISYDSKVNHRSLYEDCTPDISVCNTEAAEDISTTGGLLLIGGNVILYRHALAELMATENSLDGHAVYCDEDWRDLGNGRIEPLFKPSYSPTLGAQWPYWG